MSLGLGVVGTLKADTPIRNVKGSAEDPHFGEGGWLDVWEKGTGVARGSCCVLGCSNPAEVGAHIVLGKNTEYEKEALEGKNRVFLLPMCKEHNGLPGGAVMTAQANTPIVQLVCFMEDIQATCEINLAAVTMNGDDEFEEYAECARQRKQKRYAQLKNIIVWADSDYVRCGASLPSWGSLGSAASGASFPTARCVPGYNVRPYPRSTQFGVGWRK